ncbi:MAG: M16 family metallopeptidase [Cyclobacteriaceae bacterium]
MRSRILVLLLLSSFMVPAFAQKKNAKSDEVQAEKAQPIPVLQTPIKVTTVEGITEYKLANGLRVLLFPDPSKQTITVNITYLVGSKHENYGETGMAHLLEHLVFKGTPKHPNIPQELTEHGARPNGTTWVDRTNYFETFNATEENLKWALDLEADRMVNSYISAKDLESEMTVVRNEFEMGENSPFRVLMQRTMAAAYDWHNYGKSTIGARSDIENVPIERLQAFYRKHYQPDNAVLTVAGKFDPEKTLALISQYFGVIPKPAREILPTYTKDPTQDGERSVTVRRVGDVKLAMMAYRTPPGAHEDFAAIEVLSSVLGSDPSGRLYKALVETKVASNTGSFAFQWMEPGLLLNYAQVLKENSLDVAKQKMTETLDEVTTRPITAEEVERAKSEILKQLDLMFNSSEQVGLVLSEAIGAGDWRLLHITRDRIKAVTVEDVNRVAKHYLKPDNRTVGLFIPTEKPDRTEIPDMPDVDALVKDYKGTQTVVMGEEFDPSPSNVDARTQTITLENNTKVALLPKKTRGESVRASIVMRIGDAKSLSGKSTAGSFAASMLGRGTTQYSRQQIKDEFDKLKATVNFYGGAMIVSANIETTKPNLMAVLKLVTHILKESNFPADEFEKLKNEELASIESQQREPQAIAFKEFQRHINPYDKNDPRYTKSFEEEAESIKAVKLDEVKQFFKSFYGCSSGTTISVVGDFNASEVEAFLKTSFGGWNSPANYQRLANKVMPVEVINKSIETPDKANAMFVAGYNFDMKDDNPDYPAIVLGNFMLGGGFLNSRLATRIRQKDGLSYGVGSFINVGTIDNFSTFTSYAIYAPENVEKLEAAFKDEIEKVITDGFTDEEVAAAKSGWLQTRTVSRSQDQQLTGALTNHLFLGRTFAWEEKVEKAVEALTAASVNAAMKKYLDPSKINIIKAGDFAKAKKAEGK